MKARFRGGPLDGQQVEFDKAPLEIEVLDDQTGAQVRYVLGLVDKKGVRHYHVPSELPSKPRR